MRLFFLFLILMPLIFIEETFWAFPISLVFVISMSFVSSSPSRFIFSFFTGLLLSFLSGESLVLNPLFFILVAGFIHICRSYFPRQNLFFSSLLFGILEIIYFVLKGLPFSATNIFLGTVLFIPIFLWIKNFLLKDEGIQLQFDFIKP